MKTFNQFLKEKYVNPDDIEKDFDRKEYGRKTATKKSKENYDKKERKYRVGFMKDRSKSPEAKMRSKERKM